MTKIDIFGNPIAPVPKCKHCGKAKFNHRSGDLACPFGSKDRTGGYSFPRGLEFQTYEPKAKKRSE